MNQQLKEKIQESFTSVLPITMLVLVLSVLVTPLDIGAFAMFLVGAVFLVVGMGFFTLGADLSMMPMGEGIGIRLSKSKKLLLVVLLIFVMGFIITIAEPNLQVLAKQVPSVPNMALILTVAVGVGIFLSIAILRIFFHIRLSLLLLALYSILFVVAMFVPGDFVAVAFDSGGVSTGPVTVPFIMAMGLGLSSIRSDKNASEDSFGLVALSSIGPILAVLIMGLFYNTQESGYTSVSVPLVDTTQDVALEFLHALPQYFHEVLVAIIPILAVFFLFQLLTHRYKKRQLLQMLVGFAYALIGLIVFLTGVNIGFMPVGHLLGGSLSTGELPWLMVPLGMVLGYFMVSAEPAVHVLNKQVEEISGGAIPPSAMSRTLSIGVAVSVGIAMIRVLTGLPILWILLPGYVLAITLTFFVPKMFVGIAFDSGGVASGPMASCFLLPLAIGASEAAGGNVLTGAFGAVAMVAMTPLIAIQIMGLVYGRRMKAQAYAFDDDEITIYYDVDMYMDMEIGLDAATGHSEGGEAGA